MPFTVQQVLNRAAKRLRIIPAGAILDNEDQADILDIYNSMMSSLPSQGLTLTDGAGLAYTHTAQAASASFPLADQYFDAVWKVLMEKMIGQFPVDGSVAAAAGGEISDGWETLRAAFLVIDVVAMPDALVFLPSSRTQMWG